MQLFIEVCILYNATQIVVESTLFEPFRMFLFRNFKNSLYKLFSCFLCTSVQIGFVISLILWDFIKAEGVDPSYSWFFNSLFISCLTWFMHVFEKRLTRDG